MKISKALFPLYSLILLLTFYSIENLQAKQWTNPRTIGQNISLEPDVAVDRKGNAVAVWSYFDGTLHHIQSALLPKGGKWQVLEGYVSHCDADAENPRVGIDDFGNAVAVWTTTVGTNQVVQSATLKHGSKKWVRAKNDLSSPAPVISLPVISVNPQGDVIAVWSIFTATDYHIQAARSHAGSTKWHSVQDLLVTQALDIQLTLDDNNNAVIIWIGRDLRPVIQGAKLIHFSNTWSQTNNLSVNNVNASGPSLAIDRYGNATAVWYAELLIPFEIQAALLSASDLVWIPTDNITPPSAGVISDPSVAIDQFGTSIAVWIQSGPLINTIQSALLLRNTSTWTAPIDISTAGGLGDFSTPQIVIDSLGNGLAVWTQNISSVNVLESATFPFNSPWTPSTNIISPDIDVQHFAIGISKNYAVIVYEDVLSPSSVIVQAVNSMCLFPKICSCSTLVSTGTAAASE